MVGTGQVLSGHPHGIKLLTNVLFSSCEQVASGLPLRNGNLHAKEISGMSIKLLTQVQTFRIGHFPDEQLKLRIGLHSGIFLLCPLNFEVGVLSLCRKFGAACVSAICIKLHGSTLTRYKTDGPIALYHMVLQIIHNLT